MKKNTVNNVKLGVFVLAGLLFLIILLYMIGKNRNLFGASYTLRVRLKNANGLVAGNNVRFSGIQAGTVRKIIILEDTVIEVSMDIDDKMANVIRKNAEVSIGTDGLVGNKLVNILPAGEPASFAVSGDILPAKETVSTSDIFEILQQTNLDVAKIAGSFRQATERFNRQNALWDLLENKSISTDAALTIAVLRHAAENAETLTGNLNSIISGIKEGKGTAGALLTDTVLAVSMKEALLKIKAAGETADSAGHRVEELISAIHYEINNGQGVARALLKDSSIVNKLIVSLENIQKSTDNFNQNMEALKHSFLLRGYFRKNEKK